MKILSKIFIFIIFTTSIFAQERNRVFLAPMGGVSYVQNRTSLSAIPNNPECGTYSNGEKFSYYAGLMLQYEYIPSFLFFDIRAIYDVRPAYLETQTQCSEILDPVTDKYIPFHRNHEFDATLNYLAIDIGASIQPLKEIPFHFRLSFDAGNTIFGSDYTNIEEIALDNVSYPDGSKSKINEEGELNDAGTSIAVSATLEYNYQLSDKLYLSPHISYRRGINDVVSNQLWKLDLARAGISLKWDFLKPSAKVETKIEINTEEIEKKEQERIDSIVVEDIKAEIQIDTLVLLETIVTQTYPILPYIFFDSTSSKIKNIYHHREGLDLINEKHLPKNTIKIYYHILEILGSRLKKNPDANLTISAFTDGVELDSLTDRLELAKNRALSVRDYFIDAWDISEDRLIIKTKNIPYLPSSNEDYNGFAENRRVEFSSNDESIFEPVLHEKFYEYTAAQQYLNIAHDSRIPADNLQLKNSKNITLSRGNIIDINKSILKSEKSSEDLSKLRFDFTFKDKHYSEKVPLKILKNQFELGRLNLIVFDFDKSDLTSINKKMLRKFISTSVNEKSRINITGTTDVMGPLEHNIALSWARARSVQREINSIIPQLSMESVEGLGPNDDKEDNSTPEGRFYCRTVLIEITNPLE